MSNFARKTKQRIIDEYLQVTGLNMFKADEFVDWLANQPEHEMYDAFYGIDDATAARQWRIDMARRMASGLRIVVEQTDIKQSDKVLTIEYPAYISPVAIAKRAVATSHLTQKARRRRLSCGGRQVCHWRHGSIAIVVAPKT